MGDQTRQSPPDLARKLVGGARGYDFAAAVETALQLLNHDVLENVLDDQHVENLWFHSNPSLGFPGADIEAIHMRDSDGEIRFEVLVNFLGVHGSGSPLPDYLTEAAHWSSTEDGAVHEFNDFFTNRLVWLLYLISRKYRYERRYKSEGQDLFSDWMFAFFGVTNRNLRKERALPWPKLLSFMGLLASQSRSPQMLSAVLAHCFDLPRVAIRDFEPRQVRIGESQTMRLGRANCTLGHDTSLGATVLSLSSKIVVLFDDLSFGDYDSLLPRGARTPRVLDLLEMLLKDPVSIDFGLGMRCHDVPNMILGEEGSARIGWSSFLGGAAGQEYRQARVLARI